MRLLPIACRFEGCPDPAVAYVAFEHGCACFPTERRQYLCVQHLHETEPLGDAEVLYYLTPVERLPS